MRSAAGVGMVLILGFGGAQVGKGHMTLGDLVAFTAYLAILAWPVLMLGWVIPVMQRGLSAIERIDDLMKKDIEATYQNTNANNEVKLDGSIIFQNVNYHYPTGQFTLKDLSFKIQAGDKVLITGPTASGKSSLLQLLGGLTLAQSGNVYLNPIQVNADTLGILRLQVSYCPQDAFVFSRSIADNIRFSSHSKLSVDQAAAIAALSIDAGQFSNGWNTRVGEKGLTLSGGQRQRTALARALAKDCKILLLDDPIAQLDSQTASKVWSGIMKHFPSTTIILVSQRIIYPDTFDQIFVLSNGKIMESGKHQALINNEGIYKKFYAMQQLEQRPFDKKEAVDG